MSLGNYDELAKEINDNYIENSPFDALAERIEFGSGYEDCEYYQGGDFVPMVNSFHPEVSAKIFLSQLWDYEKLQIISDIKEAADEGDVPIKSPSDYNEISKIIGRMPGATHAIFPTKTGRPKRVHDEIQRFAGVPFGLSNVETLFLNSDEFEFERGIVIDGEQVSIIQKNVQDLDTPDQLEPFELTHLSESNDYVDIYKVDVNGQTGFYYRTVFSDLQCISQRHVRVIELPD